MKVLHLSALDGQTGAGIAAARIHQGLLARGIDSRFCVAYPSVGLEQAFTPQVTLAGRVGRAAQRAVDAWLVRRHAPQDDYVLSTGLFGHDARKIVAQERPDILQLHWIAGGAFRLRSLSAMDVPVVWRLSDMWPFCGLEHLQPDATKYIDAPRARIALNRSRFDISEYVRSRKLATYRTLRELSIVCPSRWMASEVKRSALLGSRDVSLIPTSCDTELFLPKQRQSCREALGIPLDKFVVLVGATSMGTRWKGLDLFVAALRQVAARSGDKDSADIHLVTFGRDTLQARELDGLVSIEHFGQVKDRRLMSLLYNAADVFVAPSRMENLANTVLESLASGTPVVAFNIGGMPDMIEHKRNGYLATAFDVSDLADGMRWAIGRRGDAAIRDVTRNKVVAEFSLANEVNRYIALYDQLLARAK